MELNNYQKNALTTAVYTSDEQKLICTVLGLNGEAGEVAEKIKKVWRDKQGIVDEQDRKDVLKELGDVLWYVAVLADALGWTLEEVGQTNLEKLKSRFARGKIQGSGDDR